jgi:hypothetical protein
MIRASALGIARYCGAAPRLAARINVGGRAAAMSSAFHARAANQPGWQALYENLTEEERAGVDTWKTPEPLQLCGATLHYENAHHEARCALNRFGAHVEYGDPAAITQGTADMVWAVEQWDEDSLVNTGTIIVVGDIKKSRFTTAEGPRSLQLLSYALAFADKHHAIAFACAIWISEESRWDIGEVIHMDSDAAADAWRAVKSAAMADDAYNTGAHCRDCYSRLQCPAHLLPVTTESALAPFASPGGITAENAAQAVHVVQAMEDACEKARDTLKAYAQQNGGIFDPKTGKVWKAVMTKGRPSLHREALEAAHPGLLEMFTRSGPPYPMFKWVKEKAT